MEAHLVLLILFPCNMITCKKWGFPIVGLKIELDANKVLKRLMEGEWGCTHLGSCGKIWMRYKNGDEIFHNEC